MKEIKLDFSDGLEGLVNIADYLLALHGKKCALNTYEFIEPFSKEEIECLDEALSEIEIDLDDGIYSIYRNILKLKGILNDNDDENWEEYQDLYEIILEKGAFGYSELLNQLKDDHPEFGKANIIELEENEKELLNLWNKAPKNKQKEIINILNENNLS